MSSTDNTIVRFQDVSFEYGSTKPILHEASFSVRTGSKIALMGQNGAGKSTIFKIFTKELTPKEGSIFLTPKNASIGIARQVMRREDLALTVRDYFATAFSEKKYNLDGLIRNVFEVVGLQIPLEKKVREFSGGQQARLLLAYALIQSPDILLLDEPTNNLDQDGINNLTSFLIMYEKTCVVISHDADFLNCFTDGVLYLDVFTHQVEQYDGNYLDVVEEISKRIEREELQNARAEQEIRRLKEQSEQFAHKGGKLRAVAKRMRDDASELEENKVALHREDKTIREFTIPVQDLSAMFHGKIATITEVSCYKNHQIIKKTVDKVLRKNTHLLIEGPNGIGKSTFLELIASRQAPGVGVPAEVVIGYYRQDFSGLDFDERAYDSLASVMAQKDEQKLRATAAQFLLDGKALDSPIHSLSEGQKGLLSYARLVLMQPGLLVLDEPTNHINFRHIPIIAKALNQYAGAMILVSHIPEFVTQIRIDERIDLGGLSVSARFRLGSAQPRPTSRDG